MNEKIFLNWNRDIFGGEPEIQISGSDLKTEATWWRDVDDYDVEIDIATRGVCDHFKG